MDMCQAKSQVPPTSVRVMPATLNQMARGIETASTEADTRGRLWAGNTAVAVLSFDIGGSLFLLLRPGGDDESGLVLNPVVSALRREGAQACGSRKAGRIVVEILLCRSGRAFPFLEHFSPAE